MPNVIEVLGPPLAFVEWRKEDPAALDCVWRGTYQTLHYRGRSPVDLVRKMEESINRIKKELLAVVKDGDPIIFYRLEPKYKIESVIHDDEPSGEFKARCRLTTYPDLSDSFWVGFDEVELSPY